MSQNSLKQKLLSGSIWVFAGKFITGMAQILIAMVLTRMLSPEDFGSFQVLQRVLLFLALIGSFGMAWVIVRRVAEGLAHEEPGKSVLHAKNIFFIVLFVTTCLSSLFYLFGGQLVAGLFHIDVNGLLAVLIGLIYCLSVQQIVPEGFRGLHDLKFASIFSGAATNSLMLALLLILYLGMEYPGGLSDVLYVYLAATLMIVVMSGSTLFRRFRNLPGRVAQPDTGSVMKENITAGLPLTLSGVLSFFISQADVWIVAALFSVEAAAYYAAASRLVFLISAPVMVANGATRGMIADLWARQEKEKLQMLLRSVASLTVLAAIIPAVLFVFWGGPILGLLYGSFYQQAAGVLAFLVIGQLVLLAAGPAGTLMILSGHQKQVLYFDIVSAILFFLFSFFLGQAFGAVGVAAASAIAISAKSVLTAYFTQYHLNVRSYVGKISIPGHSA